MSSNFGQASRWYMIMLLFDIIMFALVSIGNIDAIYLRNRKEVCSVLINLHNSLPLCNPILMSYLSWGQSSFRRSKVNMSTLPAHYRLLAALQPLAIMLTNREW